MRASRPARGHTRGRRSQRRRRRRAQSGVAPPRPMARRGRGTREAQASPRPRDALQRKRRPSREHGEAGRIAMGRGARRGGRPALQAPTRGLSHDRRAAGARSLRMHDGRGPQRRSSCRARPSASAPRSCAARSNTDRIRRRTSEPTTDSTSSRRASSTSRTRSAPDRGRRAGIVELHRLEDHGALAVRHVHERACGQTRR